MRRSALALLVLLLVPEAAPARTWFITPDGAGDAATIQAGLDSAAVGDTVEVACGLYEEFNIILWSGITLRSATGDPTCAVIDAGRQGRVLGLSQPDDETRLEGFTLRNGQATGAGGGLGVSFGGSPVIRSVIVQNCTSGGCGAGLACQGSSPTFIDCWFLDNTGDPGPSCGGGAWINPDSDATFESCVFAFNSAGSHGGGLAATGSAQVTLTSCTFVANEARGIDGSGGNGGHVYASGATVDASHSIFAGAVLGSAFDCTSIQPATIALQCCDVWGNEGGDYVACLDGLGDSGGNFSLDPRFCWSPVGEFPDLELRANSPCAPGGTECGLIGAFPVGCGPVSSDPASWGRIKAAHR